MSQPRVGMRVVGWGGQGKSGCRMSQLAEAGRQLGHIPLPRGWGSKGKNKGQAGMGCVGSKVGQVGRKGEGRGMGRWGREGEEEGRAGKAGGAKGTGPGTHTHTGREGRAGHRGLGGVGTGREYPNWVGLNHRQGRHSHSPAWGRQKGMVQGEGTIMVKDTTTMWQGIL